MKKKSKSSPVRTAPSAKKFTIILWALGLAPVAVISFLLLIQSEESLPSIEMLDNPPELLASVILADDGETELGKYWKINRSNIEYKDITPYVTDALISTEDERFYSHSGVDAEAIGRALVNLGRAGGGSTITQQLAKQLFTLQSRDQEIENKFLGIRIPMKGKFSRINEKASENIIAVRLEERYTKEEILTKYLNQFDFMYNAVGIANAAKVYFNKTASELTKDEAAMLVGMCKNPSLYNPYSFKVRNYRNRIAAKKNVNPESVSAEEVREWRAADSVLAVNRRNQVLFQWLKNSKKGNESLRVKLTREEYDELKLKPLIVDYQPVDHKKGIAPYFRENLRIEVTNLFTETNEDGSLKYKKADGKPWNIYKDGLKIYTTINADLQRYAEDAVERHMSENIQPNFDKNNRGLRNYPFSNSMTDEGAKALLVSAMKRSDRYFSMKANGASDAEITAAFKEKVPMAVFSWKGNIDTIMSPMDSIKYHKAFLQAGLLSIDPETGFIKAWVGGNNFDHFAYDHVKTGRNQVGSTVKPFVYATGIMMGFVKPCTQIPNIAWCVEQTDKNGNPDGRRWCPNNSGGTMDGSMVTVRRGLQMSMNNITVAIMSKMGNSGPQNIAKFMRNMNIHLEDEEIVPAMSLGTMALSLFEMVGAQATFVNNGIFTEPSSILRIEDRNGNVIYSADQKSKEVLNENYAYAVLNMMEGVVNGGTGGSLRGGQSWGGIKYPTAGKTGTTQSNSDGWFMGLTPKLVTGVWVGGEDRTIRFRSMEWGQGARLALPIYGYYMQKAYQNEKLGLTTATFRRPARYDPTVFECEGDIDPSGQIDKPEELIL